MPSKQYFEINPLVLFCPPSIHFLLEKEWKIAWAKCVFLCCNNDILLKLCLESSQFFRFPAQAAKAASCGARSSDDVRVDKEEQYQHQSLFSKAKEVQPLLTGDICTADKTPFL